MNYSPCSILGNLIFLFWGASWSVATLQLCCCVFNENCIPSSSSRYISCSDHILRIMRSDGMYFQCISLTTKCISLPTKCISLPTKQPKFVVCFLQSWRWMGKTDCECNVLRIYARCKGWLWLSRFPPPPHSELWLWLWHLTIGIGTSILACIPLQLQSWPSYSTSPQSIHPPPRKYATSLFTFSVFLPVTKKSKANTLSTD